VLTGGIGYIRCSDVTVIFDLHVAEQHGVLCDVRNQQNFSPIVCLKAKAFRFVLQLKAQQCAGMIINLLRKQSVHAAHYGMDVQRIGLIAFCVTELVRALSEYSHL